MLGRLEGAIPSPEHRDEAFAEKSRASDHDSLAIAVRRSFVALVFRSMYWHGIRTPLEHEAA